MLLGGIVARDRARRRSLFGLLLGAGLNRARLGRLLPGRAASCSICGFFVGNRGPARLKGAGAVPMFGQRFVRWATPDEREEALNDSAIFVSIGFALILIGAARR